MSKTAWLTGFASRGLIGATLVCGACTVPVGAPVSSGTPSAPAPPPAATIATVAGDVIAEVNRTRVQNRLRPLTEDAALNRAAREHSEELAARGTLDHRSTDPERETMTMRIEAAGGTWTRAAENLANMSGPAPGVPTETVRMWLDSPGHRRNMLSPEYTHTGVGVAVSPRGFWFVTQLYVLPRAER